MFLSNLTVWQQRHSGEIIYGVLIFFSEGQGAIKSLEMIIHDTEKYADFQDTQEVQEIIDGVSQSDIFLAKIMVYDAESLAAKDLKATKDWIEEILEL